VSGGRAVGGGEEIAGVGTGWELERSKSREETGCITDLLVSANVCVCVCVYVCWRLQ
jgi:hypothetical protein